MSIQKRTQTRRHYMDYAAATPITSEAQLVMKKVSGVYANPGAPHTDGLAARAVLDAARKKIAHVYAVKPQEIVFTSGATEANNVALFGIVRASIRTERIRPHIVVSAIEHSSVLAVVRSAEMSALADVTEVLPNSDGCIKPHALLAVLRPETRLVSIGWMNGELGVVQPLRALSQVLRAYEKEIHAAIVFHTDAGQSSWAVAPQPHGVDVDVAVFSSMKLYGPRGVAALYIRQGVKIDPIHYGGAQEQGIRPGTEDPILATGFATAVHLLEETRKEEYQRLRLLRDDFMQRVAAGLPDTVVNGAHTDQAPHLVNISIPHIDSEYIMYALDHAGIAVSTKSICLLESGDPVSPVVASLGGPTWRATNTLRFSFGVDTNERAVVYAAKTLIAAVLAYRAQR